MTLLFETEHLFVAARTKLPRVALATVIVGGWATSAIAAPVDALSFLSAQHGFTVQAGSSPPGITNRTGGLTSSTNRDSSIDAVDAALAVDTSDVTIGCSACSPPTPFTHVGQHRTNRADPTEFADAQFDIELASVQDEGADVTTFAFGERDVTRTGLAQARITSSPSPAEAQSGYSVSRTTTFENVSDASISFIIFGYFDAFLLSRYAGEDGFARTSTTYEVLFSGIDPSALTYFSASDYQETSDEIGDGATVTEGLFTTDDGVLGMQFTAGATALAGPGTTEASVTAEHEFLMVLTLDSGETADMFFGFSQQNFVSYTPPPTPPAVPLPASAWMLMGGFGGLFGLRLRARRRGATKSNAITSPMDFERIQNGR